MTGQTSVTIQGETKTVQLVRLEVRIEEGLRKNPANQYILANMESPQRQYHFVVSLSPRTIANSEVFHCDCSSDMIKIYDACNEEGDFRLVAGPQCHLDWAVYAPLGRFPKPGSKEEYRLPWQELRKLGLRDKLSAQTQVTFSP